MSEIVETTPADAGLEGLVWRVREATPADAGDVASAVAALLAELGGTPPEGEAMKATARELIEDREAGTVLVAESAEDGIVGAIAVNWPVAIHAVGAYGLIQDLWVHPAWRSRAVGASLLGAVGRIAGARGVGRIEVGLPREGFAAIEATAGFYRRNGFEPLGPRMRLIVRPS